MPPLFLNWVCDHLLAERSPAPQPSKNHHICDVRWSKYQILVTLNISSSRSYVIQACWLMLNICEHSNERRAGATSLEEVLKTSKKRLWMSHSVPYVVCHRLVSCLLVVVGTSQPWQKEKRTSQHWWICYSYRAVLYFSNKFYFKVTLY